MNRNIAIVIAIVCTIASMLIIGGVLGESWSGSEEELNLLSYFIGAAVAGGIQAFNESRQDSPSFESIAGVAILSYLGVGFAIYQTLIKDQKAS